MVFFLCGEGPKNFCISRELWRLEISAVEEQRPWNRGSTKKLAKQLEKIDLAS